MKLKAVGYSLFLLVGFFIGLATTSPTHAELTGIWRTEPGENGGFGDLQIYKCGQSYCGVVLKSYGAASFVKRGTRIIRGLKKNGTSYTGGEVYAVEFKMWMKLEIRETATTAARAKACYAFICKSQNWTRLK
ncbi:MAG: DUF2147 domain-containing protein [Alphaproteobacteria bacterium]